jgi:membrane protease YdiL (CAAX protease family)
VSKSRFLLMGLLKLIVALACVVGAIAVYKLLVHPALESALRLSKETSSIVRRIDIFAVLVLSYWGFVHFYERRPARELAFKWWWMLLAAGAGVVAIGVTILALYATGHYEVVTFRGFGLAGDVLGMLWVAAVLEEVAFRGILFRLLEERIGTMAAAVGSALVFGVVHMSNNGAGWLTLLMVFLGGLMWALLFVLTRNLWVTSANHFCWNSTIFAIGVPLSGDADVRAKAPFETVYHGSTLWTGGTFGPEDSLINIAILIGICGVLWYVVRKRGQVLAVPGPQLPEGQTVAISGVS